MIKEFLIEEAGKRVLKTLAKILNNTTIKVYSKERDIIDSLQQHVLAVKNWSDEINFSDLKFSKSTRKAFVNLDLFYQPLRVRLDEREVPSKLELSKIFSDNSSHVVLLGQVGSGKTTSLKYFCQSLIFNQGYFESAYSIPIVVRLKELNSQTEEGDGLRNLLVNSLINILGIKFDYSKAKIKNIENFKEKTLINVLNENRFLVLLDGFDEIVFNNWRQSVLSEFEKLSYEVTNSKLIITSRTSDFKLAIPNVRTYEICPLTDAQIKTFAQKWLENDDDAEDFLLKIKRSPFYDTTIRPLTVAHLCALYERSRTIPEKPKTIYKKIVMLLLEEWDMQRNIQRKSKYSKFEIDRKFEFLSCLAFNLTILNKGNYFSKHDLNIIYKRIHADFDLPEDEALLVIREIESHNGLIQQSSFEKYEFAHKSIQEYLTAEYIVKLPSIPASRSIVLRLANELAIAVAISSNSSIYFYELIQRVILPQGLKTSFIKPFISRLLLEKIDFNKEPAVGFAALALYSAYINSGRDDFKQYKLFHYDGLIKEFEELIYEVFKRNTKAKILESYKIKSEIAAADGTTLYLLEATKLDNKLPVNLYCRKYFLDG